MGRRTCPTCRFATPEGASACNPEERGCGPWVVAYAGEEPHIPADYAPDCPGWDARPLDAVMPPRALPAFNR